jgi:hypothetical protein
MTGQPKSWRDRLEVHPAADLFPMMSDEATAELAQSIKENGQRETIKLLGGKILDGRNRYRACILAEVEPRLEDVAEDVDPIAFVADYRKRVETTAGQRAIAAAEAWMMAEAEGKTLAGSRGDIRASKRRPDRASIISDPRNHFAKLFGSGHNQVEMARALIRQDPDAAAKVKAGGHITPLYEALMQRLRGAEVEANDLKRLREVAPDLALRVDDGELRVSEARAIFNSRETEAREDRATLFRMLREVTRSLGTIAHYSRVNEIVDLLKVEEYVAEFHQHFKSKSELIQGLGEIAGASAVIGELLSQLRGDHAADRRAPSAP